MADKNADLTLSFQTDRQKIEAARKDVAALAQSYKALDLELKNVAKTTGTTAAAVGNNLKQYSAGAISMRNETLKGTKALQDQQSVLERYRRSLASAQATQRAGSTGGATGGLSIAGRAVSTVGNLSQLAGVDTGIQRIGATASQAAPLLQALGVSEAAVATATPVLGAAMIALSLAVKVASDAIAKGQEQVKAALDAQKEYYQIIQTGTKEEIKSKLDALKAEQIGNQAFLDQQVAIAKGMRDNEGIFGAFKVILGGIGVSIQDTEKAMQSNQFQIDALTKAYNSQEAAVNSAKKANEDYAEELKTKFAEAVRNAEQITDQIAQAQKQAEENIANILQRAADQRIAIAEREAQAEEAALTNLQRNIAEDRIKLGQQEADDRLNYQREEAQSAKQHQANLLKIRKDAENNEFELILNRDFAGLAASRRQTEQRLQEEDDRYAEERRQRLTQLKQKLKDDQTAFVREREARLRAYNQQLADLRQAQIRDLKANEEAARLEITRLNAKLAAEIKMQNQAYAVMLAQERNFYAIRQQLLAGLISAMQAEQLANYLSKSTETNLGIAAGVASGEGLKHRASGGYLGAGQLSTVNERRGQREIYTAGGRSIMLPGGMGIFKPLKSGRVDSGQGGGINISIPIGSITGDTWSTIARKAGDMVEDKIVDFAETLTA